MNCRQIILHSPLITCNLLDENVNVQARLLDCLVYFLGSTRTCQVSFQYAARDSVACFQVVSQCHKLLDVPGDQDEWDLPPRQFDCQL